MVVQAVYEMHVHIGLVLCLLAKWKMAVSSAPIMVGSMEILEDVRRCHQQGK
jgi:hypothetical protein